MSQPLITTLDAMKIVGVGGDFISVLSPDQTNMAVIPRLWEEYGRRRATMEGDVPPAKLGVVTASADEPSQPHRCHYIAGHQVPTPDAVPEGMEALVVPPATYAVFTHRGPIERIGEIYARIYGQWLPTSGFARGAGAEFERYDERFMPGSPDSEVDIYIPIVGRS